MICKYFLPICDFYFHCCCLVTQLCLTLCSPMDCSMPGFPVLHHLPELAQTHVHWVSDAIQPSHPLSSPFPLAFNLSQHQVFSSESALCIRWPKYWSFSFSVSPSNEYSRLISFRIDWCDLLAVQETLKSLLQHQSSKASVLRCSAFFMVQFSQFFEKEKFFIFMKSNLSIFFSFVDHAFSIILKKSLPNPESQRFFSSVISYSLFLYWGLWSILS